MNTTRVTTSTTASPIVSGQEVLADVNRMIDLLGQSPGAIPTYTTTYIVHPVFMPRLRQLEVSNFGLGDIRIIESVTATVRKQVRFPRSKRRRIIKKWRNNPCNFIDEPVMYIAGKAGMGWQRTHTDWYATR